MWLMPAFAAFLVAIAVTRILITVLGRRGVMDVPNERSSHTVPTPRGGGIGILAGVAGGVIVGLMVGAELPGLWLWAGAAAIAITGWMDDRMRGLSAGVRLLLQIGAAIIALVGTGGLEAFPLPEPLDLALGPLGWPLAIVWIVAVTNFYNFLDGIDGYAGAQGVLAGSVLLMLATAAPALGVGAVIAAACAGFLVFNWHQAQIFMGDVGSATLGFLFAALPFHAGTLPAAEGILVMGLALFFFIADGVFTLARRLRRGERVWEAHRSHLYQRLTQTGLRHDQVVIRIGLLAVPTAGAAVLAGWLDRGVYMWTALILSLLLFGLFTWHVARRERFKAGEEGISSSRVRGG
jgi:UDP-N-acetylmuramyl pentapeptide phosphotransferase/UDP-N-acetylglucosamine-1-phosphate transferase